MKAKSASCSSGVLIIGSRAPRLSHASTAMLCSTMISAPTGGIEDRETTFVSTLKL